jgi:hypothetical protein
VVWWEMLGKTATRKTRRRWEENIEMYLREVGFGGMDWMDCCGRGCGQVAGCFESDGGHSDAIKSVRFLVTRTC